MLWSVSAKHNNNQNTRQQIRKHNCTTTTANQTERNCQTWQQTKKTNTHTHTTANQNVTAKPEPHRFYLKSKSVGSYWTSHACYWLATVCVKECVSALWVKGRIKGMWLSSKKWDHTGKAQTHRWESTLRSHMVILAMFFLWIFIALSKKKKTF